MRKYSVMLMMLLMLALSNIALGNDRNTQATSNGTSTSKGSLIYRPQPGTIGKPTVRIGGGTRGTGDQAPLLAVLAPDHGGLTVKNKPTLCWFLSDKTGTKLEITINDDKSPQPLFEHEFTDLPKGGTWCLNLYEHAINLEPNMEYQWFVAIVPDPEHRSKDIVSTAMIKRINPMKELTDKLSKAKNGLDEVAIYASEGIWYDAISALTKLIEENPTNKDLQIQRATLLEQVGLAEVAKYYKQ